MRTLLDGVVRVGLVSVFALSFAIGQAWAADDDADTGTGGEAEAAVEAEIENAGEREADVTVVPERTFDLSGSVALSFRRRTSGSHDDNDLYGYLRLDGAHSDGEGISFHLHGRLTFDLDDDASKTGSRFRSLNDIFGRSLDGHIYEAYVDVPVDALGLTRVRLGRQTIHAAYTYLVDGFRLDFAELEGLWGLRASVFGGLPTYLYDSSRKGDWIVGIDLPFQPAEKTRFTLRFVHVEDGDTLLDNFEVDNYLSLTVFQGFGDHLRVTGEWNTIDGESRDASLRVDGEVPDIELTFHGAYVYQNAVTEEFTAVYDTFSGTLGKSYAYHNFDFEVTKLIGDHLGLDVGFAFRDLVESDREGPFNREYQRVWLSASALEWPNEDWELSITGELWSAKHDRESSIGAEATWFPAKEMRVRFGTYYSLYKYDLFAVDEREDVTTWFLKFRYRIDGGIQFDGRCEFEHGDEGHVLSLLAGLTWRF